MHTSLICFFMMIAAWNFDNDYPNGGFIIAPLYLLTAIAEVVVKILRPSTKDVGYRVAYVSHFMGSGIVFVLASGCGWVYGLSCYLWLAMVASLSLHVVELVDENVH